MLRLVWNVIRILIWMGMGLVFDVPRLLIVFIVIAQHTVLSADLDIGKITAPASNANLP